MISGEGEVIGGQRAGGVAKGVSGWEVHRVAHSERGGGATGGKPRRRAGGADAGARLRQLVCHHRAGVGQFSPPCILAPRNDGNTHW